METEKNPIDSKIELALKVFAMFGFLMFVFYVWNDNKNYENTLRQYNKTKDSLEGIIQKYQSDYYTIKLKADYLDSLIKVKSESVRTIRTKFYVYRDREIKNPDSAINYVKKFIIE